MANSPRQNMSRPKLMERVRRLKLKAGLLHRGGEHALIAGAAGPFQMEQAGDEHACAVAEAHERIGEAVAHRHRLPRGERRQEDAPDAQNQPVAQTVCHAGQQAAHGAQEPRSRPSIRRSSTSATP